MSKGRVILVSNRLPVMLGGEAQAYALVPSSGGLAAALKDVHNEGDGRWLGWVGDLERVPEVQRAKLRNELEQLRLSPVPISRSEVSLYYDGYSNAVLWPLFHYLLDTVR